MPARQSRETEADRRRREREAAEAEHARAREEYIASQQALGGDGTPMSREEYDRLAADNSEDWEAAYGAGNDADAARAAEDRAERGVDDPFWTGGGGGGGYGGGGGDVGGDGVTQLDRDLSKIPIIGGGFRDEINATQDEINAAQNRGIWFDLGASAPSVDALTPDTYLEANADEYGDLYGDPSQLEGFGSSDDQRAAMSALRSLYESGGYTEADHNMSRALRDQQAMQMGAANQASMQQMQARGMGGSGAELAMRMGSADSMAGANSMADAQLQQAAMQRALQGLQSYGSMSNTMQDQEMSRRNALDQFNQSNTDWRRGRETRNTTWSNQGARDRTSAVQQAYENRRDVAAGATNQYGTDVNQRNANRDRQDEREGNQAAALAELFG